MANLKVNTDLVITAANNIQTTHGQIRSGFDKVQAAMTKLGNAWEGAAATSAVSKFNELKSNYPDARYNVVDNYVNFLLQQVGAGYEQTEDVNKSLADAFK